MKRISNLTHRGGYFSPMIEVAEYAIEQGSQRAEPARPDGKAARPMMTTPTIWVTSKLLQGYEKSNEMDDEHCSSSNLSHRL